MKRLLACLLIAAPLAAPVAAQAQDRVFSADVGLGVSVAPTYPGADDAEASPWILWRNAGFSKSGQDGPRQGFSVSPSFGIVGPRDADDDDALLGMAEIDRSYEIGGKVSYSLGATTAYASLRRGFGGHEGLVGAAGLKYRTDINDRFTLWSGLEVDYANGRYNQTYFGVSAADAVTSGYAAYDIGGGINKVAAKLEARYALSDRTALLGELEYGRLVGDAADSPLVQDRDQPAVRLGIVRTFSFGF